MLYEIHAHTQLARQREQALRRRLQTRQALAELPRRGADRRAARLIGGMLVRFGARLEEYGTEPEQLAGMAR